MNRAALLFLLLGFPVAAFAAWRRDALAMDQGAVDMADDYPATLPEPGFLESLSLAVGKLTRGERNNNPGNIRKSSVAWQGKTTGTDSAFETFTDPIAGIRATAVLLKGYANRRGLRTVRQIISTYAPASENDTAAYIADVCAAMGVSPDSVLNLDDQGTLAALVGAIIRHENGRNIYTAAQLQEAIARA